MILVNTLTWTVNIPRALKMPNTRILETVFALEGKPLSDNYFRFLKSM